MTARVDLHTASTSSLLYASSLDPLPRSHLPSLPRPRSPENQPRHLTASATGATIGALMSSIIRLRESGDPPYIGLLYIPLHLSTRPNVMQALLYIPSPSATTATSYAGLLYIPFPDCWHYNIYSTPYNIYPYTFSNQRVDLDGMLFNYQVQ